MHVRAQWIQSYPNSATLWTVAHQAPLSLGFSRQEHWSGLLCSPPGDRPDPQMDAILHWQVDSLPLSHLGSPVYTYMCAYIKG